MSIYTDIISEGLKHENVGSTLLIPLDFYEVRQFIIKHDLHNLKEGFVVIKDNAYWLAIPGAYDPYWVKDAN